MVWSARISLRRTAASSRSRLALYYFSVHVSLVENLVPVVCRKVKKKRDIALFFDTNEMMHIWTLLPHGLWTGAGAVVLPGQTSMKRFSQAPLASASDIQTERPNTAREREREQKRRESIQV
jgi:hypothetical protein